MSEERRRRRRQIKRETVGTLVVTYKAGKSGPALPKGVVRQVDLRTLRSEMPKYRVPGQRGGQNRPQAQTVTIPFFRTRSGAPGLTPSGSVVLRPGDLTEADLTDTFEVEVPDLS